MRREHIRVQRDCAAGALDCLFEWDEAYNVIPGTLHRASYVNVPPGKFTFRAMGLTNSPDPLTASISDALRLPKTKIII